MRNQVFKNLRKIARIVLNIVCGVISIMFVIAFIATMKWNFLILAGSMAILYALVYLLSVSSEAIKKEYITAQMQIRMDEPIVFDKKKVLRSYLTILSFVWIMPYLPGIVFGIPKFGFIIYMPMMVLFFVVSSMLEKYLDVFPFKKRTYRLINFTVHAALTVASLAYFFFKLS